MYFVKLKIKFSSDFFTYKFPVHYSIMHDLCVSEFQNLLICDYSWSLFLIIPREAGSLQESSQGLLVCMCCQCSTTELRPLDNHRLPSNILRSYALQRCRGGYIIYGVGQFINFAGVGGGSATHAQYRKAKGLSLPTAQLAIYSLVPSPSPQLSSLACCKR